MAITVCQLQNVMASEPISAGAVISSYPAGCRFGQPDNAGLGFYFLTAAWRVSQSR